MNKAKSEPILSLSVLAAVAIAILQGVANGHVTSLKDFALIAVPIIMAAIGRQFVTPVPVARRRG